ncbi:MAG: DedA family protein [Chlamydiales bacterium]
MEVIFLFIQDHVQYAHWMVFGLLMLAGLNFPISEDLLIIVCGVFSSTVAPQISWKLFIFLFLGAYLSDWMVYWIGRVWGSRLWRVKWFAKLFHPKRLKQIEHYYKRFGLRTLLVGRFIPFGVRNCLFATAGMGKMPFGKFLLGDGVACLLSNTTLFTLSYFCGKNFTYLMKYIHMAIFSLFLVALIIFICYKRSKSSIEKEID